MSLDNSESKYVTSVDIKPDVKVSNNTSQEQSAVTPATEAETPAKLLSNQNSHEMPRQENVELSNLSKKEEVAGPKETKQPQPEAAGQPKTTAGDDAKSANVKEKQSKAEEKLAKPEPKQNIVSIIFGCFGCKSK